MDGMTIEDGTAKGRLYLLWSSRVTSLDAGGMIRVSKNGGMRAGLITTKIPTRSLNQQRLELKAPGLKVWCVPE